MHCSNSSSSLHHLYSSISFFLFLSFPFLSFINLFLLSYFMFRCPLLALTSWANCEQRELICIFLWENKINEKEWITIYSQNLILIPSTHIHTRVCICVYCLTQGHNTVFMVRAITWATLLGVQQACLTIL